MQFGRAVNWASRLRTDTTIYMRPKKQEKEEDMTVSAKCRNGECSTCSKKNCPHDCHRWEGRL